MSFTGEKKGFVVHWKQPLQSRERKGGQTAFSGGGGVRAIDGKMRILVYGIGNIDRGDDALGVLCARRVEGWCRDTGATGVDVRTVFQLTVEDAERLGGYGRVCFCDASIVDVGEVALYPVEPEARAPSMTHTLSPEGLLGLSHALYGPPPEAYVLHMQGEEFGVGERLSERGKRNLAEGFRRLLPMLLEGGAT